ncbi:MAG: J domain-containing protein [FCB group bacterium]|nr:J domain-containing protein [FCB group bacterium]
MMTDPLKMLGLDSQASPDEIKRAFRSLAKKYHPDIIGGSGEKFKRILLAYEQLSGYGGLSSDEKFDWHLKVRIDREKDKVQDLFDDLRDGFLTFFDIDLPEFLNLFIELTPVEAARGGRIKLELPLLRKCRECYGFGQILLVRCKHCGGTGEQAYNQSTGIDIPPGMHNGYRLQLLVDNLHLTVIFRLRPERSEK